MINLKKITSWKYFGTAAAFSVSFAVGFFMSEELRPLLIFLRQELSDLLHQPQFLREVLSEVY